MKTTAKLVVAAFIVTICVALGFGIAEGLEIPTFFVPLFLLPAAFIFARIAKISFDWIKMALCFLLIGASIWLTQVLVPEPYGNRYPFLGPLLLILFFPLLERTYECIRRKKRHNNTADSTR